MAEGTTTFRLEIAGADQVAAGFEKVKGAIASSEAETAKAATTTKALGDAHDATTPKLSQFGSTLGMVGSALGQANPALGTMVSTIGQAAGSVTALEAAMGPLGIAIGVATTAFALYERATAKATDAIDAQTNSLSTYIAKVRQADEQAAQFARTQVGLGSAIEQAGRVQQAQARYAAAASAVNRGHLMGAGDEFIARQELAAANAELHDALQAQGEATRHEREYAAMVSAQATADAQHGPVAANGAAPGGLSRRGGGGRGAGGPTGHDTGAWDDTVRSSHAGETTLNVSAENDRNAAKEMQRVAAIGRAEAALDARRRSAADARMQRENHDFQERLDHIHEEAQAFAQYGGQIADIFIQASETQGNFGKALAEGFKHELQGLGKTELIKGLSDEAEAIGLAFVNPPAAGAKAISGAQHLAISALAFGGSAIAGAAAGGGGAGGAGGGSAKTRPIGGPPGTGAAGGSSITVQILGPMVAAGSMPALGRAIDEAIRAGRHRYGTRADGTAA